RAPRKHKTKNQRERQSRQFKTLKTKTALPAAGPARRPLHVHGIKKKERKDQEPKNQKTRNTSDVSANSQQEREGQRRPECCLLARCAGGHHCPASAFQKSG